MNKQDEARRKRLRRLLKDEREQLTVAAEDLRWLLDEASRLQQANDRLRRQNRRLRLRHEREAGPDATSDDATDDAPNAERDDG
jgi:hypothetical protein